MSSRFSRQESNSSDGEDFRAMARRLSKSSAASSQLIDPAARLAAQKKLEADEKLRLQKEIEAMKDKMNNVETVEKTGFKYDPSKVRGQIEIEIQEAEDAVFEGPEEQDQEYKEWLEEMMSHGWNDEVKELVSGRKKVTKANLLRARKRSIVRRYSVIVPEVKDQYLVASEEDEYTEEEKLRREVERRFGSEVDLNYTIEQLSNDKQWMAEIQELVGAKKKVNHHNLGNARKRNIVRESEQRYPGCTYDLNLEPDEFTESELQRQKLDKDIEIIRIIVGGSDDVEVIIDSLSKKWIFNLDDLDKQKKKRNKKNIFNHLVRQLIREAKDKFPDLEYHVDLEDDDYTDEEQKRRDFENAVNHIDSEVGNMSSEEIVEMYPDLVSRLDEKNRVISKTNSLKLLKRDALIRIYGEGDNYMLKYHELSDDCFELNDRGRALQYINSKMEEIDEKLKDKENFLSNFADELAYFTSILAHRSPENVWQFCLNRIKTEAIKLFPNCGIDMPNPEYDLTEEGRAFVRLMASFSELDSLLENVPEQILLTESAWVRQRAFLESQKTKVCGKNIITVQKRKLYDEFKRNYPDFDYEEIFPFEEYTYGEMAVMKAQEKQARYNVICEKLEQDLTDVKISLDRAHKRSELEGDRLDNHLEESEWRDELGQIKLIDNLPVNRKNLFEFKSRNLVAKYRRMHQEFDFTEYEEVPHEYETEDEGFITAVGCLTCEIKSRTAFFDSNSEGTSPIKYLSAEGDPQEQIIVAIPYFSDTDTSGPSVPHSPYDLSKDHFSEPIEEEKSNSDTHVEESENEFEVDDPLNRRNEHLSNSIPDNKGVNVLPDHTINKSVDHDFVKPNGKESFVTSKEFGDIVSQDDTQLVHQPNEEFSDTMSDNEVLKEGLESQKTHVAENNYSADNLHDHQTIDQQDDLAYSNCAGGNDDNRSENYIDPKRANDHSTDTSGTNFATQDKNELCQTGLPTEASSNTNSANEVNERLSEMGVASGLKSSADHIHDDSMIDQVDNNLTETNHVEESNENLSETYVDPGEVRDNSEDSGMTDFVTLHNESVCATDDADQGSADKIRPPSVHLSNEDSSDMISDIEVAQNVSGVELVNRPEKSVDPLHDSSLIDQQEKDLSDSNYTAQSSDDISKNHIDSRADCDHSGNSVVTDADKQLNEIISTTDNANKGCEDKIIPPAAHQSIENATCDGKTLDNVSGIELANHVQESVDTLIVQPSKGLEQNNKNSVDIDVAAQHNENLCTNEDDGEGNEDENKSLSVHPPTGDSSDIIIQSEGNEYFSELKLSGQNTEDTTSGNCFEFASTFNDAEVSETLSRVTSDPPAVEVQIDESEEDNTIDKRDANKDADKLDFRISEPSRSFIEGNDEPILMPPVDNVFHDDDSEVNRPVMNNGDSINSEILAESASAAHTQSHDESIDQNVQVEEASSGETPKDLNCADAFETTLPTIEAASDSYVPENKSEKSTDNVVKSNGQPENNELEEVSVDGSRADENHVARKDTDYEIDSHVLNQPESTQGGISVPNRITEAVPDMNVDTKYPIEGNAKDMNTQSQDEIIDRNLDTISSGESTVLLEEKDRTEGSDRSLNTTSCLQGQKIISQLSGDMDERALLELNDSKDKPCAVSKSTNAVDSKKDAQNIEVGAEGRDDNVGDIKADNYVEADEVIEADKSVEAGKLIDADKSVDSEADRPDVLLAQGFDFDNIEVGDDLESCTLPSGLMLTPREPLISPFPSHGYVSPNKTFESQEANGNAASNLCNGMTVRDSAYESRSTLKSEDDVQPPSAPILGLGITLQPPESDETELEARGSEENENELTGTGPTLPAALKSESFGSDSVFLNSSPSPQLLETADESSEAAPYSGADDSESAPYSGADDSEATAACSGPDEKEDTEFSGNDGDTEYSPADELLRNKASNDPPKQLTLPGKTISQMRKISSTSGSSDDETDDKKANRSPKRKRMSGSGSVTPEQHPLLKRQEEYNKRNSILEAKRMSMIGRQSVNSDDTPTGCAQDQEKTPTKPDKSSRPSSLPLKKPVVKRTKSTEGAVTPNFDHIQSSYKPEKPNPLYDRTKYIKVPTLEDKIVSSEPILDGLLPKNFYEQKLSYDLNASNSAHSTPKGARKIRDKSEFNAPTTGHMLWEIMKERKLERAEEDNIITDLDLAVSLKPPTLLDYINYLICHSMIYYSIPNCFPQVMQLQ